MFLFITILFLFHVYSISPHLFKNMHHHFFCSFVFCSPLSCFSGLLSFRCLLCVVLLVAGIPQSLVIFACQFLTSSETRKMGLEALCAETEFVH